EWVDLTNIVMVVTRVPDMKEPPVHFDVTGQDTVFHGQCHLAVLDALDAALPGEAILRARLTLRGNGCNCSIVEKVQDDRFGFRSRSRAAARRHKNIPVYSY